MARWTVEFDGGGHVEVDARSEYDARKQALHRGSYYDRIIEVRPFAAKPRAPRVDRMPAITVKPDPFEKLRALLPHGVG